MSSLAAGHIFGKGRPALPNRADKGPAHGNLIEMLEQDRLRISQELHDDLGQRLALLEIHLTQIEERCPCPETARGISAVRDRIREMDRDVHRVCCQLYPVLLEKFGLVVALRALCRDFSQLGIRTDFMVDNCPRLSPSVSLCIYRVAQEALHNISKHSKAKYAKVSVRGSPRRIEIVVEDEGVGFDPSLIETTAGLGLASIEERVRRAGGRCFITSTPGAGTEVRAAFYTFIVVE